MGSFRIPYSFPTEAGAVNAHSGLYLPYVISTSDSPWRGRLSQWRCGIGELSTDQRYKSTGKGTFFSLALWNEVRKSTRERKIHHYLSVLCACGCDFSCFQPPFLEDQICLDHMALWPPLQFHCLPSLLFDGHTQACITEIHWTSIEYIQETRD